MVILGVGDKVRILRSDNPGLVGKISEVTKSYLSRIGIFYKLSIDNESEYWTEDNLEFIPKTKISFNEKI